MCSQQKKKGNLKFCLADFVSLIQMPSRKHYNARTFQAQIKQLPHSCWVRVSFSDFIVNSVNSRTGF